MSSNSSANSSFAEIVKHSITTTIKTVKVVKVEKFSPVKAVTVRANIMATPAYKRKRRELESFSPIKSAEELAQESNIEAADKVYGINFSVRRRKRNIVNKSRQINSCNSVIKTDSASTQTKNEAEEELIQKYIDEVNEEFHKRQLTSFALQVEKEKALALRSTLINVVARCEIASEDFESRSYNLNRSISAANKPDFSSSEAIESYHKEITRGIKIKKDIHKGLLASLKSIEKECNNAFKDLKRRDKEANRKVHPWCPKTNSCRPMTQSSSSSSQASSQNSILSKNMITRSSARVPFNPDIKFLKVPVYKSVQFRVPLNEFLFNDQSEPQSSNELSNENIEIEIPVLPNQNVESQAPKVDVPALNVTIPKDVDLSLLNISTSSSRTNISEVDQLQADWNRFAASHKINEDDVGSLLDYDSSTPASPVFHNIKREAISSDEMPKK